MPTNYNEYIRIAKPSGDDTQLQYDISDCINITRIVHLIITYNPKQHLPVPPDVVVLESCIRLVLSARTLKKVSLVSL